MAPDLDGFLRRPTGVVHEAYDQSVFAPVAPEYSTSEVVLAGLYRALLLGERDASIDLDDIPGLAQRLASELPAKDPTIDEEAFRAAWEDLLRAPGSLASPQPGGQQATRPQMQLMPLVPELARVSGVLGKVRNRWQPGNLALSALACGSGPEAVRETITTLRDALQVTAGDDYLARWTEGCLDSIEGIRRDGAPRPEVPEADALVEAAVTRYLPAWRARRNGFLPSERFVQDLRVVLSLKPSVTRRQWTVVVETVTRLGLGMHQLWLCRLNARAWDLALAAAGGQPASAPEVEEHCWRSLELEEHLLELGENAMPAIRRAIANYAEARMGINLLLFLLEQAGRPWRERLGKWSDGGTPASAYAEFLAHVASNSEELSRVISDRGYTSLGSMAGRNADGNTTFLGGRKGLTRNLLFFIRHTLGQLQPVDDTMRPYDQGYLLAREDLKGTRWPVQPAPAMLILLVHCCCQAQGRVPASMDSLREHLLGYGIGSSADELRSGNVVRDLERLGLVVDSPDAGGGRLIVDPLPGRTVVDE